MPIPPNLCSCGILFPKEGACPKCQPKKEKFAEVYEDLRGK